jgi:hypothetical protein
MLESAVGEEKRDVLMSVIEKLHNRARNFRCYGCRRGKLFEPALAPWRSMRFRAQ